MWQKVGVNKLFDLTFEKGFREYKSLGFRLRKAVRQSSIQVKNSMEEQYDSKVLLVQTTPRYGHFRISDYACMLL